MPVLIAAAVRGWPALASRTGLGYTRASPTLPSRSPIVVPIPRHPAAGVAAICVVLAAAFASPRATPVLGAATRQPLQDVDGDGRADIVVYRPSVGEWWIRHSTGAPAERISWGAAGGDIPMFGDYNGDGIVDLTVYRPATGTWYIRGVDIVRWGTAGDVPVPGDY